MIFYVVFAEPSINRNNKFTLYSVVGSNMNERLNKCLPFMVPIVIFLAWLRAAQHTPKSGFSHTHYVHPNPNRFTNSNVTWLKRF